MALYPKAALAKKTPKELKDLAIAHGLDIADVKKSSELIELLMLLEDDDALIEDDVYEEEELEDEELEEELDEELDDGEVDEVDEPAPKKKKAADKKPAVKKKAAEGEEETLAAKQVATILGTEAKVLRQFFRSDASTIEPVGSGGRYEFAKSDIDTIKKEFEAWKAAHAARGTKRGPGKGKSSKPAEEVPEVEEIEELDDEEDLDDELDEEDLELEDEE